MNRLRIAVIGAGAGEATDRDIADARLVGALLAPRATVICGGRGGVMSAVSEGVASEGGTCVGILPGEADQANAHVTLPIATGLGEARNIVVVTAADGVVAVGGAYGTLSEIAFALKLGRPLVGLHTWRIRDAGGNDRHVPEFDAPDAAVDALLQRLDVGQGGRAWR